MNNLARSILKSRPNPKLKQLLQDGRKALAALQAPRGTIGE